ncbi:hypothetical protein [Alistipes shahii]|uniref:hypothetical protein n=1 Tax=Alistipes shahii TaxID=328814 RepID=UPI003F7B37F3
MYVIVRFSIPSTPISGGLYWCNRQSNGTSSWDINVSTYDFNHFGSNAFLISDWTAGDGPNVSDACFVRLVE